MLAALAVPEARFAEVANQVNTLPEVAHNDQRNHRLNMWFVLATAQPDGIARACARIEADTGFAGAQVGGCSTVVATGKADVACAWAIPGRARLRVR